MEGLGFLVLVAVVFGAFFAVAIPAVTLINRAIGKSYETAAQNVFRAIAAEGIVHAEDDVPMTLTSVAVFAASRTWRRADVRVTPRAIYVAQYGKNLFFGRMGQPMIVVPLGPWPLHPLVSPAKFHVAGAIEFDGRSTVVPLAGAVGRHTLRLESRSGPHLANLASRILAGLPIG